MTQRIIKFRAWRQNNPNNPKGKMHQDVGILNGVVMSPRGGVLTNSKLMQFTGLLDKNGKEIYEFDYLETGGTNVWWVRWGSGKYILQNISTGDIIDCNENHTQRNEVVGNSFESPREHKTMASDI